MVAAYSSDDDFMRSIENAPVTVDQWQLEKLALVTERMDVLFYVPGLPSEYHSALWGKSYSRADDAVHELIDGLPENARVALIPEGPYVLARVVSDQVEALSS